MVFGLASLMFAGFIGETKAKVRPECEIVTMNCPNGKGGFTSAVCGTTKQKSKEISTLFEICY